MQRLTGLKIIATALVASVVWAQTPLKIRATRGDGAFNNIKSGVGQEIEVEVRDENDRPVAGAEVTFLVPIGGAGGSFPGSGNTFKTTTDESGTAKAPALRLTQVEGRFNIKVTATKADHTGTAVLSQVSTTAGGAVKQPGIGKGRLILGLVGTGASVGILLSRLGGGGSSSSAGPARPPTTLSVGAIAVGGPR